MAKPDSQEVLAVELLSKSLHDDLSGKVGAGNGSRVTLVDSAVFLWFRGFRLGSGRYSLEGRGHAILVQEMSEVWQALLADDYPLHVMHPETMCNGNVKFDGSIPLHYDRFLGPVLFRPFAEDLAARLETGAESSILELACGTGILTEALRNHLPTASRLTATDLSQPMLDYAKAKLAGVNGITWGLADASSLEFSSDSFDAVLCQFGLMFVPDKAAALSEIYRVLRPDGVLLFSVWDAIQKNQFARIAHETVAALFPDPPDFYEVPFSLSNQDELAVMLGEADFIDLEFDVVSKVGESPSARDAAIGLIHGNPIAAAIRERNTIEIETVVDAIAKTIATECGNAPALAKMQAVVISAWPNKP